MLVETAAIYTTQTLAGTWTWLKSSTVMLLSPLLNGISLIILSILLTLTSAVSQHRIAFTGSYFEILKCNTSLDFSVTMYFTPTISGQVAAAIEIYDRNAFLSDYEASYTMTRSHPGQYILETNLSQHHQAGRYQCYDNEGNWSASLRNWTYNRG